MPWEPHGLIEWLLHVVLGFGAAGAALVALAVAKGGKVHRWAGWLFSAGMLGAAVTTWIFMRDGVLPLAIIQSTLAVYGLGTALLALNPQWRSARAGEFALLGLLVLVMLGVGVTAVNLLLNGTLLIVPPLVFLAVLGFFAVLDVRYLRREEVPRADRVRRHALRMALVVSETVRAPTLTFADELGLPFPAIVFGSFLLVPLVYFAFIGRWRQPSATA